MGEEEHRSESEVKVKSGEEEEEREEGEGIKSVEEGERMDEGGWAWVVVLASFLCNMVIDGLGYSFGVLLEPIQREFKAGSGSASFVGSILAGVILLTGPIAAFGVNRFGTRATCMTGSVIAGFAIFSSSFSPTLFVLILTYGVLGGIGLGLMYVPAVVAVGQYFSRRLSFATGLCVTGSGVGTFVFAPIASALVQWAGWRGCNRVMAGVCSLGFIFGLALAPRAKKQTSRRTDDGSSEGGMLKVLKSPALLLVMAGNVPAPMAVYITYTYLPSMAQSLGFSLAHASLLISVVGVTNTIGRICSGWVTDLPKVSALVITIIATGISSIFPILMPLTPSYPLLVVLSGVFGFVISALPTVTSRLLVDLVGIQHLNSSFGALTFVRGFAALLGPPIAGFALDRLQSVAAPFTLSTIFLATSTLIHLGVWFLVRLTDRRCDYEQI